jgi:hypothetical protein
VQVGNLENTSGNRDPKDFGEPISRKQNVKLTEYTIVGPMLAAFIASLSRKGGMSRNKIQDIESVPARKPSSFS